MEHCLPTTNCLDHKVPSTTAFFACCCVKRRPETVAGQRRGLVSICSFAARIRFVVRHDGEYEPRASITHLLHWKQFEQWNSPWSFQSSVRCSLELIRFVRRSPCVSSLTTIGHAGTTASLAKTATGYQLGTA